jgi:hypothetical protein
VNLHHQAVVVVVEVMPIWGLAADPLEIRPTTTRKRITPEANPFINTIAPLL